MRTAIRRSADATAVLLSGLPTALPALIGLLAVPVLVLVLPFAPEVIRPLRSLAGMERSRVGRVLGHDIPEPYLRLDGDRWQRFRTVVRDPATRRDLGWLFAHGAGGTFLGVTAVALWPAIVFSLTTPLYWWLFPPATMTAALVELRTWPQALTLPFVQAVLYSAALYRLVPVIARGQTRLAQSLLGPTDRALLAQQVERLTETRTEALESHGAELRRIERDLHDGVQAQLVAVAVRLGLTERALSTTAATAATEQTTALSLVRDARTGIEDSLANLRGVIRGIYPPILADRGLGGAVQALAGGQRIPVSVSISDNLPRPPAPIEAAAYFVVAESLTNVTKHSTAQHAEVVVDGDGTHLRIIVRDNGQGGASSAGGSGLLGIQRRVAALDGSARIDSPVDGGTTIEVLLPCG
ncbi:histidine kinase [Saccharothrix sp. ALI-22-I]|uniref:sensor histidine kinase n=1 Tax=Saccharothrix sp. ALI-22-I TaxID=1933778 RepID=UPI00097C066C|nr:sensor histidine kinase [Saccharothrix sp. ALI-22-I]ONI92444.1 histidine kinase [Saccharothrix sp. ALI-22-I]